MESTSWTSLGGRAGEQSRFARSSSPSRATRSGAAWRPVRLSPGRGLLALMAHTVPVRRRPAASLVALRAALAPGRGREGKSRGGCGGGQGTAARRGARAAGRRAIVARRGLPLDSRCRMKPDKRTNGLVVTELQDEVLVYDLERHRAHCLNPTAAFVFRRCDGRTSVRELARAFHAEGHGPDEESLGVARPGASRPGPSAADTARQCAGWARAFAPRARPARGRRLGPAPARDHLRPGPHPRRGRRAPASRTARASPSGHPAPPRRPRTACAPATARATASGAASSSRDRGGPDVFPPRSASGARSSPGGVPGRGLARRATATPARRPRGGRPRSGRCSLEAPEASERWRLQATPWAADPELSALFQAFRAYTLEAAVRERQLAEAVAHPEAREDRGPVG